MQKTREEKFTIMVVPHSQKPPFSFRLPLVLLQAVGLALVFVPTFLVSFFNSYSSAKAIYPELELLRNDNQIKSEQIGQLANETQKMLDNLQRVQTLERKLMEMNDLDDSTSLPLTPEHLSESEEANNFRTHVVSRSYTTVDRTMSGIQVLQTALPDQEDRMATLKETIEEQQRREAATPSRWPTWGRITSPFGWRRHPITWRQDYHTGIDIAGSKIYGSPIYATAKGTVTFAGYRASYGYLVIIEHGYGFSTYYAHQSRLKVKAGQAVETGDVVGYVGNSGVSTGAHLHYEVRRWGTPVNPINYLP
jgi:murein DD-endopeptidase MepM/ murein hydrolase activator NlpD